MYIQNFSSHSPEVWLSKSLANAFETYSHDEGVKPLFRSLLSSFETQSDEYDFLKRLKAVYFAYIYQRDYGELDLHLLLLSDELPTDIAFQKSTSSLPKIETV